MLDNSELESVMEKLENLEDEVLAVSLLKEFNDASSEYGKLIINQSEELSHEQWKDECDKAKIRLDDILEKINNI